jgi:hypothetical protein
MCFTLSWSNLRKDIQKHPTDEHKLPLENEDQCLKTVDCCNHGERNDWYGGFTGRNDDNQVDELLCQLYPMIW